MSKRHDEQGLSSAIRWEHMDIRDMEGLADSSVHVAFDKATLDTLVHGNSWSPTEETLARTVPYLREVSRVLRPDGVFLCVSFRQPHFVKPLLECEGTDWDVEIETLPTPQGSLGYYAFVCKPRSG